MKCGNFTTHQSEIIEHELHHAKANVKFCLEFYLFSFIKGQFSSSMARALTVRFMHGAQAYFVSFHRNLKIQPLQQLYSQHAGPSFSNIYTLFNPYMQINTPLLKKKSVKISSQ